MEQNKIHYKSIAVSVINKNIIIFHMHESEITDDYSLVLGISTFNEFVGHQKPKYVIFDKRDLLFDSSNKIQGFLKTQGVDQLLDFGVKRIFFIVSDKRFEEVGGIFGYKGISAYKSLSNVLAEIEKEEEALKIDK